MRNAWRPIWVLALMALLCTGAAFVTLQAVAQSDARTIEDDPTIAPDPQESADNNISFPVDI